MLTDLYYAHDCGENLDAAHWDLHAPGVLNMVRAEQLDVAAVAWLVVELFSGEVCKRPLGSVSEAQIRDLVATEDHLAMQFAAGAGTSVACGNQLEEKTRWRVAGSGRVEKEEDRRYTIKCSR